MNGHIRMQTFTGVDHKGRQTIAATIHWPDHKALREGPPVLACFPGVPFNRHYFDLPEAGYSQAAHHAANGMIVIAIDHLGVGESSIPPPEDAHHADLAAANHAALRLLLEQLRAGTLGSAGPIAIGAVIGVGHSMGGHVAVVMQAHHRSFDGVAVLGSYMARIRLPSTAPWREIRLPAGVDPSSEAGIQALECTDWRFASHWDNEPEHLVRANMAVLPPGRGRPAPWSSPSIPNVGSPLEPGVVAREAASIDVPVLIGVGERDVCLDLLREIAAFQGSRDVAAFEVPRMAHMHNFAETRELMWLRLDAFARQVAALKAAAQR